MCKVTKAIKLMYVCKCSLVEVLNSIKWKYSSTSSSKLYLGTELE